MVIPIETVQLQLDRGGRFSKRETGTRNTNSTAIMRRELQICFIFIDIISPSNNDEKNENEKTKGRSKSNETEQKIGVE